MKPRIFSVIYMFLLTLFFTSVVSGIKLSTGGRISTNEKVKLQRIILGVLKYDGVEAASDREVLKLFQNRIRPVEIREGILYAGYEKDGKRLRGIAFHVGGPGFWGPISGMVGVDSRAEKVIGVNFYRHSETPGLGGRMTERWFRAQFEGLSLTPGKGQPKLFLLKTSGTKKAPNELDAITGATGTSRGIEAFLNRDLERFRKEIWVEILPRLGKDAETS